MHLKTIEAVKTAAQFLRPPLASYADRANAKDHAAGTIRATVIRSLIEAGHDDLASQALELAQKIEARENG